MIVVSLLWFSEILLRSEAAISAMTGSRVDARMAQLMSIGDLQKQARSQWVVVAKASILGEPTTKGHRRYKFCVLVTR